MISRRRMFLFLAAFLFACYSASYLWLSRRGYEDADRDHLVGFYYARPENTDQWRAKHFGCMYLFLPLNSIDRALGIGRYPASEPLWGLSR